MANEATIASSLRLVRDKLSYQSQPQAFNADVSASRGPSPGLVLIPTTGRDIYFTELTTPGLCRLMNLDTSNYVEVGVKDPQSNLFYPLLELLPGESYVIRFSRNLQEQYTGSGTGTTGPENYLRLKANGATVACLIDAFEK